MVFVADPANIVSAQRFASFFLLPGMGCCHFMPGPLADDNCCKAIVQRISCLALLPLSDEDRKNWRETHMMVVGCSRRMANLVNDLLRVGPTDSTVLLLGEPGVGKELVANALHRLSPRYEDSSRRRFLHTVNIAALGMNLLEDDLFGHVRGAFTGALASRKGIFEAARGSTVFLDEIGDITAETQVKLLRAIEYHRIKPLGSSEEREIDMRLIAATNHTLPELQARFRPDFYSRLVQNCIVVPSLKERWQDESDEVLYKDLAELADFVVERASRSSRPGKTVLSLDEGALKFLVQAVRGYIRGENTLFCGNIRILCHLIERAYERAKHEGTASISVGQMISAATSFQQVATPAARIPTFGSIKEVVGSLNLEEIERRAIAEALEEAKGNLKEAAGLLGIHVETVRRKLASKPKTPPTNN